MASGHKLAVVTLVLELGLALALVSKNFGLFALMAMPFVGVAWLPAAGMIFLDPGQGEGARPLSFLAAVSCLAAGTVCFAISARWIIMAMFVR